MNTDLRQTFHEKLFECNRHVEKIQTSKKHLSEQMPLTAEIYKNLDDIALSFLDQLIFRFSKLQDTIGEKIFPSILKLAGEEIKKKTFIDILNRLEELEILKKNDWLKLRAYRNEIAHEYSYNIDEVVESVNKIYDISNTLIQLYEKTAAFSREKFGV